MGVIGSWDEGGWVLAFEQMGIGFGDDGFDMVGFL